MQITIIDYEKEFLKIIGKKFEKYGHKVNTYTTSKLVLEKEILVSDLILVNKKNLTQKIKTLENVIIISEKKTMKEGEIFKYQKFTDIYNKVLEFVNNKIFRNETIKKQRYQNKRILIVSLIENGDATNNIIKYLNNLKNNEKMLYIDFKTFSNIEEQVNFDKEYPSIINVFYDEKLEYKKYILKLNKNNVDTLYPSKNALEYLEIKSSEKIKLVEKILKQDYSRVFIEIDNKFDEEFIEWTMFCDSMLVFVNKKYKAKLHRFYNTISNLAEKDKIANKICEVDTLRKENEIHKNIQELLGDNSGQ